MSHETARWVGVTEAMSTTNTPMVGDLLANRLLWIGVAVLGAVAFGIVALTRGEPVNAAWLVIAAVCIYLIAYRFYARYIADTRARRRRTRLTPAYRHNDGLDYVPTNRYVLFGHHFAAIAGAGPLVGPVLAAQMGYLPGTLWILVGVVFAGAVQDMTVLFFSTRRDGRSLGDMIRAEMGPVAGTHRRHRHAADHDHPARRCWRWSWSRRWPAARGAPSRSPAPSRSRC